ncbi:T3SS (YopN, CesT) and YbjN peptide-binding chaperone 1 [Eisenibacter elegans]|jgi:hypothetical protein|uniref:T3SS (YopN, CesT) and YbjN peptide-binding chaperone 1 n=1 Tax=Eisenibacter elegans TaxID=997 RepID=UPI00041175F9|nr:hypothetical protein [Eisenibacter elegans]
MPKFQVLKSGVNEALIAATRKKIEAYTNELFHDYEIIAVDDLYSFSFGSITVNIEVLPWHSEDVLVKVYAYIAEGKELSAQEAGTLLHFNANIPFGAFGMNFEKQAVFSYSLAGANIDLNEFQAAVQMVAKTADEYDEVIKEGALSAE